jgi:hypothetical protein
MDGCADRWAHLLSSCLGLGPGRVRRRRNRLPPVSRSLARTAVTVVAATGIAVPPSIRVAVAAASSIVPPSIRVAVAAASSIGPASIRVAVAAASSIVPVATLAGPGAITAAAATFARAGAIMAAAATTTTTAAASVRSVGVHRHEGYIQTAKEWYQREH